MPTFQDLVAALDAIAPFRFAEEWDNVGVLLDPVFQRSGIPGAPAMPEPKPLRRVLLAIDVSEEVAVEALELRADAVVAYHPVIFSGLKRLTTSTPLGRTLMRLISASIPVVSPHTALDAAVGGVNDWLAEPLGDGKRWPVVPILEDAPAGTGMGRHVGLAVPTPLNDLVAAYKGHLGLERLRVAACPAHADGAPIFRAAVCAGAGGSILARARNAELLVTGEMRHHDVREAVARGTSVILCDHTNTERGYLPRLAARLDESLVGVEFVVSRVDADPLVVV